MIRRFIIVAGLATLVLGGAAAQSLVGTTMYVAVKTATLKNGTGLFAGKTGTLDYGAQVTVLQQKGSSVEVRASAGLTGWVGTSSLTSKRIVSSGGTSTASTKELALAGKGFSEETGNASQGTGELDYAPVDAMEAVSVSDEDLLKFLTEGHLKEE